jgi:hypothetical protein
VVGAAVVGAAVVGVTVVTGTAVVVAGAAVVGVGVAGGVEDGDTVVVVRTGEAAAWAGTITEFTTGRVQDLGSKASAALPPTPAPIAFRSGRRSISFAISKSPKHHQETHTIALSKGQHC